MKKQNILSALFFSAMVTSTTAHSVNFNAFDPKSIAMGGVGVAIADPATAPFFNPALLSIAEKDDDFSIELPVFGFRISDPKDFIDKADGMGQLVDNLDAEINTYNVASSSQGLRDAMTALNQKTLTLSDSPLGLDGGLGLVISIPSETFGLAFTASGSLSGVGQFKYNDGNTVTTFINDMGVIDGCRTDGDPIGCMTNPTTGVTAVTVNGDGTIAYNTDTEIQSEGQFIGVAIAEIGLSISREFFIGSTNVSFGVTPKAVSISIVDYRANASTVENVLDDIRDVTTDYSDFNLDFGVAKDFENGWRAGATIKNLISQEYESKVANPVISSIKLEPQIRAGVSHHTDWTTIAFDLDLTENESFAVFDNSGTQYAALGLELNVWDVTQLRFGYRADLVNDNRDVLSAGIGFSPLGLHFDLGVAVGENENEGAISFQFGFRI